MVPYSTHLRQEHQGCEVIDTGWVLEGPDEEAEDRAIVPTVLDDQGPAINNRVLEIRTYSEP